MLHDAPTEAVADDADLAGLTSGRACGRDIVDDLLEVERTHGDLTTDLDVFGGVAELDAGAGAVEDRRCDGEVSGGGVSISDA